MGCPRSGLHRGNPRSTAIRTISRPRTLWYHDHAVGITRLNVYAGMSGFYLLRDEQELSMNLPSGEYEIPLVLQDRTLDDQGQLVYAPTHEDGTYLPPGRVGAGVLRRTAGGEWRHLSLSGCRAAELSSARPERGELTILQPLLKSGEPPDRYSFAGDISPDRRATAACSRARFALNKLLLAPAERADLIVDFSGLAGKTVTLSNDAPAPYPGWTMLHAQHAPLV